MTAVRAIRARSLQSLSPIQAAAAATAAASRTNDGSVAAAASAVADEVAPLLGDGASAVAAAERVAAASPTPPGGVPPPFSLIALEHHLLNFDYHNVIMKEFGQLLCNSLHPSPSLSFQSTMLALHLILTRILFYHR